MRGQSPEQPLQSSLDLVLDPALECCRGVDRETRLLECAAQPGRQHDSVRPLVCSERGRCRPVRTALRKESCRACPSSAPVSRASVTDPVKSASRECIEKRVGADNLSCEREARIHSFELVGCRGSFRRRPAEEQHDGPDQIQGA